MHQILLPPNLLTWLRVLLTPIIVWRIGNKHFGSALLLMFIAGVTDAFDGYFARRFSWESQLGAYIDPIADKLLLTCVYLSLGYTDLIPAWLVALVIGRDVLILGMVAAAFVFTNYRKFPPSLAGKISTIVQMSSAVVILADSAAVSWSSPALQALCIWSTAITTAWSGLDYVARGLHLWKDKRIDPAPCETSENK